MDLLGVPYLSPWMGRSMLNTNNDAIAYTNRPGNYWAVMSQNGRYYNETNQNDHYFGFQENDDLFFENFLTELKKIIKLTGIPKLYIKNFSLKKLLEQIAQTIAGNFPTSLPSSS